MKLQDGLRIEDFRYDLPDERIAKYPAEERDGSMLLDFSNGVAEKRNFRDIAEVLPKDSLLLFNNTKVVRARMIFRKDTGARIEIFLLNPVEPSTDHQICFASKGSVVWECIVGNLKKWKSDALELTIGEGSEEINLKAEKLDRTEEGVLIKFDWDKAELSFSELIESIGQIPLPPYIKRENEESDTERYQTVYASFDGSVAAPTAGLHFTQRVFEDLGNAGIKREELTLHVGAGTFKPVDHSDVTKHHMHEEHIVITKNLLNSILRQEGPVIAVGTTTTRSLESLYWFGLKCMTEGNGVPENFVLNQWDPYQFEDHQLKSRKEVFAFLLSAMDRNRYKSIKGITSLMIAPGYSYKVIDGLVTNFHQPGSTLLLLVAALVGDKWKEAYDFALKNNFRFLSYGDSCFFMKA